MVTVMCLTAVFSNTSRKSFKIDPHDPQLLWFQLRGIPLAHSIWRVARPTDVAVTPTNEKAPDGWGAFRKKRNVTAPVPLPIAVHIREHDREARRDRS